MTEIEDLEKAREVIADQEKMLLEYGSNNKKLLEENDTLKKDVEGWKELATKYDDDMKVLKQEKAELEDGLKTALIKPASELSQGQIIPIPVNAGTLDIFLNAIEKNADILLIEYYEGNARALGIHI